MISEKENIKFTVELFVHIIIWIYSVLSVRYILYVYRSFYRPTTEADVSTDSKHFSPYILNVQLRNTIWKYVLITNISMKKLSTLFEYFNLIGIVCNNGHCKSLIYCCIKLYLSQTFTCFPIIWTVPKKDSPCVLPLIKKKLLEVERCSQQRPMKTFSFLNWKTFLILFS